MQYLIASSAIALREERENFICYGREGEIIPEDVIRVRIHPSVRAIKDKAFERREKLAILILNDEL